MKQLHVSLQHSIATLAAKGWSARKIAGELGVHRETVGRYLQPVKADSNPAIPPTGSADPSDPKPAILPAGSEDDSVSKPVIVPTGSKAGRTSQCASLTEVIEQGLIAGLSAQRIYQDLVTDHQFTGGYDAVKRFVRRLVNRVEPPFRRMECAPGHELQVDFGQGAWVIEAGKRRRPHLFRAVLSHSRKGYSEVVWQQTSESFIRCLENAFRHLGGVTTTVVSTTSRRACCRPIGMTRSSIPSSRSLPVITAR